MKERWRQLLDQERREYREAHSLPRLKRVFEDPDQRFYDAQDFLRRRQLRSRATPDDLAAAAGALIQDVVGMDGDPRAWALVLAVYNDIVAAGEAPPMPILAALSEVFDRIRGGMDWADAIRGDKAGKGRPPKARNLAKRGWSLTNAEIVAALREQGLSYPAAIEKAARMRGAPRRPGQLFSVSESAMRADYEGWLRRTKPKKR